VIAISQFLKNTLLKEGIDADKIHVIPLGFDAASVIFKAETESITNRPLRLLYAGKITQRKGILYLLEAIKRFDKNDVELHIIGNLYGNGDAFATYKDYYNFSPGISQIELFKRYADYDVLVFPSLLEGFGLVTVEAMGAGLPVITTANTNATEVLQDGKNGYLVPIRSVDAIANAIANIRNMDNATFQTMRHNARQTALQYTWDIYRNKLASYISTL
jgi:glycosyltransferase involved in cell wall biosynthesis